MERCCPFKWSWSQAGAIARHGVAGNWETAQQELVMIGIEMNQAHIIQQLDICLLTDQEIKLPSTAFDNPFEALQ